MILRFYYRRGPHLLNGGSCRSTACLRNCFPWDLMPVNVSVLAGLPAAGRNCYRHGVKPGETRPLYCPHPWLLLLLLLLHSFFFFFYFFLLSLFCPCHHGCFSVRLRRGFRGLIEGTVASQMVSICLFLSPFFLNFYVFFGLTNNSWRKVTFYFLHFSLSTVCLCYINVQKNALGLVFIKCGIIVLSIKLISYANLWQKMPE